MKENNIFTLKYFKITSLMIFLFCEGCVFCTNKHTSLEWNYDENKNKMTLYSDALKIKHGTPMCLGITSDSCSGFYQRLSSSRDSILLSPKELIDIIVQSLEMPSITNIEKNIISPSYFYDGTNKTQEKNWTISEKYENSVITDWKKNTRQKSRTFLVVKRIRYPSPT